MAHEMYSNDGLALANTSAWHGLGTVVKGVMNPFAALKIAGMEWDVLESDSIVGQFGGVCMDNTDGYKVATDVSKLLIRSDDKTVLGVVGKDYSPFQNSQLAELAYALRSSADGNAEVETAGSIRGGKRVYMTLRGESVQFGGKGDETVPYLFLANGHDGSLALKIIPTGVRVVCSNTFHLALGARRNFMSFRHTLNLNTRVEELAACVKSWQNTIERGSKISQDMAATPMNREQIQSLWLEVITKLDGAVPTEIVTGWDARKRDRAVAGLAHAARVFDIESQKFGANLWIAANAITNWVEHSRAEDSIRSKDAAVRQYAAWDGSVSDDVAEALDIACERIR